MIYGNYLYYMVTYYIFLFLLYGNKKYGKLPYDGSTLFTYFCVTYALRHFYGKYLWYTVILPYISLLDIW